MTRIKGGMLHAKRRKGILAHTKGFRWGRKSKIKVAKIAKYKAGQHAFTSRRTKKRINRGLWNIKINAAAHIAGTKYSALISALKKKGIALDRKVLAQLAEKEPKIFAKIAEMVK
ncbi:MAG: 50S ribosomal protein L20 [Candidatus Magasanikbacteria bacterium RIFOXYA2_FULL_44_8]|uniref:50S ribosomal protein L20 n=1 Tax=Candidatus Magasanikbacteria bacterium RIFOXYA2_FULL_44_8 TaxID=1798696 RepID=A0A1F6NK36_9BACT|nr:MAG: 50S ribosomal protein L20 [Candidatus Magasanikbacteria bacterium RIFOXYA2_FULL_44_8]